MSDTDTEADTFRDENGYALADYNDTADGHYHLLGIDVWGGWYYSPTHHRIANYEREEVGRNNPMSETDEALTDLPERTGVGAFVAGAGGPDGDGGWSDDPAWHEPLDDLSTLGAAMLDAHRMVETGAIARRQAECVALFDRHNATSRQASRWLGISRQRAKNNATDGRKTIESARQLVVLLD